MPTVVISAGRGPKEVRDFVADLASWMLSRDDEAVCVERGRGSVVLQVGDWVGGWLGTHELVDAVRGRGQRRRWYATVAAVPGPREVDFDPSQVHIRADRAGGPGGQHVNTTASAVRATYLPLGWTVRVATERSQHRNRAEALRRLRAMHAAWVDRGQQRRRQGAWQVHDAVVRGDPVVRWRRERGRLVEVAV